MEGQIPMTVVRARARRVWDVQGYDHLLSCGCWWFDRGVAVGRASRLTGETETTSAHPAGTAVFCSLHERV